MQRNLILLLLVCTILMGCSHNTGHVYTIAYYKDNTYYVYDENNNMFKVSDNTLIPHKDPNMKPEPAIHFEPVEEDYGALIQDFPGHYTCTPTKAFSYITSLCHIGYRLERVKETPYLCELKLKGFYSYHIFIEKDTTRMYCVDKDNNPVIPDFTVSASRR